MLLRLLQARRQLIFHFSFILDIFQLDPDRIWKGAWRWFSEEMLDCCSPLEVVRAEGLTLDEFACTATCSGAKVTASRLPMTDLESETELEAHINLFRNVVSDVCSSTEKKLVVSYNRATLLQTGTGHFSPIGGYHAATDQVLIMDVARFKYPPHWVPLKLLVKSMSLVDPITKLSRGYMLLERSPQHISAVLRVNTGRSQWRQFADSYRGTLLVRLKKGTLQPTSVAEYLKASCDIIKEIQVTEYLVQYVEALDDLAEEHQVYIKQVFEEVGRTRIMKGFREIIEPCCNAFVKRGFKEISSIFMLAQGPIGLEYLPEALRSQVKEFLEEDLEKDLADEVDALRTTLAALSLSCECSAEREKESCHCCQTVRA